MSKIKLVMSDLDDTLLYKGEIASEDNIVAIEKLIDNKIMFVPTTGRYFKGIPEYFRNHKDIEFVVSSNGSLITNIKTNEVIMRKGIDKQLLYEVIKTVNDDLFRIMVTYDGGITIDERLYNNIHFKNNEFYKNLIKNAKVVDDILKYINETDDFIKKIDLGFEDFSVRDRLYEELQSIKELAIVSSHPSNIEITSSEASKGNALLFLQNYLNIDNSEIFAIGDNDNDISMLSNAGVSVSVNNASEHVKSHSDYTTSNVEDGGFSQAINNYVL